MIQAICWVLIHSIWQGLLFTVITGLVMMVTRKASAACRYNCLSVLLLLFLLICGVTFLREWNIGGKSSLGLSYAAPFAGKSVSRFMGIMNQWLSDHAPLIVIIWSLLFIAKCVRMTAALVYAQRVRSYRTARTSACWQDRMKKLCERLHIKKTVLLMESGVTRIPIVIGHLKPVIFIPLGLLTNLPEGEIEAVLLHELAHIRRNDYLVNLLQNIAETIFFFNPGLLWISSLLRQERENCCDDMAITQTGDKIQFLRALVSFKEHALVSPQWLVAFPGSKNQLYQRVMRIVHNRNSTMNPSEKIFFGISGILAAALLFAASANTPLTRNSAILPRLKLAPAQKSRVPVIYYSKTITYDDQRHVAGYHRPAQLASNGEPPERDADQAMEDARQALRDADQAGLDAAQAKKDAETAKKDAEMAKQNADQAERDRLQAEIDRRQAGKDHWRQMR
jgi:bla regulator protein BlaR1